MTFGGISLKFNRLARLPSQGQSKGKKRVPAAELENLGEEEKEEVIEFGLADSTPTGSGRAKAPFKRPTKKSKSVVQIDNSEIPNGKIDLPDGSDQNSEAEEHLGEEEKAESLEEDEVEE